MTRLSRGPDLYRYLLQRFPMKNGIAAVFLALIIYASSGVFEQNHVIFLILLINVWIISLFRQLNHRQARREYGSAFNSWH